MKTVELIAKVDSIKTREDLAEFVECLRENLLEHAADWENVTLENFLDALSSVIIDMEYMYINRGLIVPEAPNWMLVGEMLLSATVYE